MKHHQALAPANGRTLLRQKAALATVESTPKGSGAIRQQTRAYFVALGAHITQLRKAIGMTQAELARALGVSQQSVFAYELGDRRVSVVILLKLAKIFQVTLEELARMATPAPTRGPKRRLSPRVARHAERIQGLSKTHQRFVVRILDVLESGDMKWSANQHGVKPARCRRQDRMAAPSTN